jgi:excisionase family DNA binding protein
VKTAPALPRLLTCQELADRTGLGRSTWYELVTSGEVPCYRVGRAVRISEADAAQYLAARREATG